MNCPSHVFHRACTVIHILSQCVQHFDVNDGSQGNIIYQIALKQLWRPEGRQLAYVQQFLFIIKAFFYESRLGFSWEKKNIFALMIAGEQILLNFCWQIGGNMFRHRPTRGKSRYTSFKLLPPKRSDLMEFKPTVTTLLTWTKHKYQINLQLWKYWPLLFFVVRSS